MLGSSVAYGMAMGFADTIPAVVERELQAAGHRAEVLNFGTHGFTIVNLSAQLQAYVHQFRPDAVVAVVDLQVGTPAWPTVHPAASPDEGVERLGWWGALLRRGSERSALLALFDEPRRARRWVRRTTGLPLRPRTGPTPDSPPEARSAPPRRRRAQRRRPPDPGPAGGRPRLRGEARA